MTYLTFSIDDFLNTNNNETVFLEIRRYFEEVFDIKVQEESIPKHLNFRIFQCPLGFSVDQTDKIMELVS